MFFLSTIYDGIPPHVFFEKKAFVSLLVKVYGAVMAKQQESTVISKLRELTRDLTIAREKKVVF